MQEETGITGVVLDQLHAYGNPGRDPRGWIISIAHVALIPPNEGNAVAADDAADARWFKVTDLPRLAFDHSEILGDALDYLRDNAERGDFVIQLLPAEFTLTQLQTAYEVLLGERLDKRNFRRKVILSGMIVEAGVSRFSEGRPARLYTLTTPNR